jgi:hypothetical protein
VPKEDCRWGHRAPKAPNSVPKIQVGESTLGTDWQKLMFPACEISEEKIYGALD